MADQKAAAEAKSIADEEDGAVAKRRAGTTAPKAKRLAGYEDDERPEAPMETSAQTEVHFESLFTDKAAREGGDDPGLTGSDDEDQRMEAEKKLFIAIRGVEADPQCQHQRDRARSMLGEAAEKGIHEDKIREAMDRCSDALNQAQAGMEESLQRRQMEIGRADRHDDEASASNGSRLEEDI